MPGAGLHGAELILLLLLLFVVAFAALAQRLATPYPIVLVIAGLLLGFAPGMPKIELKPDVIFFVILPPLLYSAALGTAWEEFRYNLVSKLGNSSCNLRDHPPLMYSTSLDEAI